MSEYEYIVDVFNKIYLPYRKRGFVHNTVIEAFRMDQIQFVLGQMYEAHLAETQDETVYYLPAPRTMQ